MTMDDTLNKEILLIALEECLAYVFEVISDHPNYQGICKGLNLDAIKRVVQPFIREEATQYSVSDLENWLASPKNNLSCLSNMQRHGRQKGHSHKCGNNSLLSRKFDMHNKHYEGFEKEHRSYHLGPGTQRLSSIESQDCKENHCSRGA